MLSFTSRSKSTAILVCAALLGSAILAPAAMAHGHSGGNAFQIPGTNAFKMYWGEQNSAQPAAPAVRHNSFAIYSAHPASTAVRHTSIPQVVQRSTTNPNCQGGYSEMDRSEAANGVGMVMKCHS